nr:helix-turn-helix domain-containing protein [Klebsiella pneumoniae]
MTAQRIRMLPAARVGRAVKPGTANREQLMDIALTLFARDGAGRVSLNAIAKEAGVTPAMLHYYFSSRDALVTQLIEGALCRCAITSAASLSIIHRTRCWR